ncbi:lysine-specific demethylase JMJ31 isoform X2 [Magnolia sinica]|uniref:lysine-specific demethylase JMJ31 isoform X2 n=1 Tax=Magnolia sinica TaxID=86752 RepID=UPI0026587A9B|nr:lysine-specific demethylase JMJ31 isoform X2 [Magnolia sinica]
MEGPALEIHGFEELPSSSEDFSSNIESRNVPAVFHGCLKGWKAFSKWNPSNGGLDYLQERVGSSIVEAMLSRSAPVFYGDLRSHERVPFPFSTFISSCKRRLRSTVDTHSVCTEPEGCGTVVANSDEACLISKDAHQVYLAQVPISNIKNKERSSLEILQDDIIMPAFLERSPLASINLWMNNARSRSSTHYDPHHNLLCVVAGCKQVVLWPPSASSFLYPMPIYGEASNHSSVDIESPDFSMHSRAKNSMNHSQKVILQAGDALYIPEGWFHQVDSDDLTIAVNIWWQSNMMANMSEHMDAYYLRRIIRRLVDKEMNQMLQRSSVHTGKTRQEVYGKSSNEEAGHRDRDSDDHTYGKDLKGNSQKHGTILQQLEPVGLQAFHELVSLVHDSINVAGQSQEGHSTSVKGSTVHLKEENIQVMTASFCLEDDPVANILWTLKPLVLQHVLSSMVHNFPRTLEALILHMLTPVGAEVLTQKFDEMDQQTTKEEQNGFYRLFYSVFDDQFAAMDAILNGKELFAFQNLKMEDDWWRA